MQVVYAKQPIPEAWTSAIFLAGPTPRDPGTPSWRPDALRMLEAEEYDGVVFVPEAADGSWGSGPDAYIEQVEWERQALDLADVIVFWVPRDMKTMPALTTNVEFGRYVTSDKVILGAPEDATSIRYLEKMLKDEVGGLRYLSMASTIRAAIDRIETFLELNSNLRRGGERCVPLHIWTLRTFQDWYAAHRAVGNRLDDARLLWHFRMPKAKVVFSWVLWVKVWIENEQRWKENEFVLSRTDISTVLLYHHADQWAPGSRERLLSTEIILVREFRSPVRNSDGFVHELAGGSSVKPGKDPRAVAASEVHEETGLIVDADRFTPLGSRQLAATLSSHHAHVYAAEITAEEMAQAKLLAEANQAHGVEADSERTYVEVTTVGALLSTDTVDWSTLGMLLCGLLREG